MNYLKKNQFNPTIDKTCIRFCYNLTLLMNCALTSGNLAKFSIKVFQSMNQKESKK